MLRIAPGFEASTRDDLHVAVLPIGGDPAIPGDDRHAEITSRRYDQTVAWITMQLTGKKGCVDCDRRRHRGLPDAGASRHPREPSLRIGHEHHRGGAPRFRARPEIIESTFDRVNIEFT